MQCPIILWQLGACWQERLTCLIKLPPAFFRISSLLLDSWLASLSAYATRFGWEPRDMNLFFRLSLKAKEALLRKGFLHM